jgi:hypothetical protein
MLQNQLLVNVPDYETFEAVENNVPRMADVLSTIKMDDIPMLILKVS